MAGQTTTNSIAPQTLAEETLAVLTRFAGAMMRTQDLDPMYPVLRQLNAADGHGPLSSEALRRSIVYVAFYNIAASECVVEAAKRGRSADVARQLAGRAGIERRGLRTPEFMVRHLNAIAAKVREHDSADPYHPLKWLTWRWREGMDERERWSATTDTLLDVPYNGRWAAYKMCDVLAEVHGMEMEAPDAGHRWSTGPREGLEELAASGVVAGLPAHSDQSMDAIRTLDRATSLLQRELWERGVPMKVSEVETILCNWKALVRGKYYVGHDIDEMLGQVNTLPQTGEYAPVRKRLLRARRASFAPEMLGEIGGWTGVRRPLMRMYADHGELVYEEVAR